MNDKENARTAAAGNASPAGKKGYRIALAGNPNCGKTTLFNAYTGSRQHVGNYPGVTVDRKEGTISVDNTPVTLVDLPGTYSLTAYSQEELVARDELSLGRVDAVIDCADASALERNMLLTVQMMEMGMPVVLACNMMDEARKAGIHIDMQKLSEQLGTPVLPIVARNGEGIREVARAALDLAKKGRKEPLHINYGPELTEAVEALEKRLSEEKILIDRYHPHWTALKLLEGDTKVQESVREARPDLAPEILSYCEGIEEKVKAATQATCESVITDARYGYIRGLLAQGVVKQDPGKDRLALSDRLDKILTNRFLGPLIMIGVLYLMFVITFNLGAYPQEWLEDFFAWMGSELGDHMDDGLLKSLICDGIIAGVGGVVSFVPLIAIMFALIAFIEDSGYSDLSRLLEERMEDLDIPYPNAIIEGANLLMKIRTGVFLRDVSPIKEVKKSTLPILFIHGSRDELIPPHMMNDLAAQSPSPIKEELLIKGGRHAENDTLGDVYFRQIFRFLEEAGL